MIGILSYFKVAVLPANATYPNRLIMHTDRGQSYLPNLNLATTSADLNDTFASASFREWRNFLGFVSTPNGSPLPPLPPHVVRYNELGPKIIACTPSLDFYLLHNPNPNLTLALPLTLYP